MVDHNGCGMKYHGNEILSQANQIILGRTNGVQRTGDTCSLVACNCKSTKRLATLLQPHTDKHTKYDAPK